MKSDYRPLVHGLAIVMCVLAVAACHNGVSSRALVRPTPATGAQALHLLRGETTDPELRYVYGYWAGGTTDCNGPHPKPSGPDDRYGGLLCQSGNALSVAYFVDSWNGTSRVPDEKTNQRLAYILTDALVPAHHFSRP